MLAVLSNIYIRENNIAKNAGLEFVKLKRNYQSNLKSGVVNEFLAQFRFLPTRIRGLYRF